jgi:hypothetical protein
MDRINLRLDLKTFRAEMVVQLLFGKGISFVKLTKYQATLLLTAQYIVQLSYNAITV